MTTSKRHLCSLLLGAAALAAGCGSSGEEDRGAPIPAGVVESLGKELDLVQERYDVGRGACGDIQTKSRRDIRNLLGQVPNDVDPDVRRALRGSVRRLFELAREQCNDSQPREEKTTPEETETEPPPPPPETMPQEPIPPPETAPQPDPGEGDEKQKGPELKPEKPKKQKENQGNGGGGGFQTPEDGGGAVVPEG